MPRIESALPARRNRGDECHGAGQSGDRFVGPGERFGIEARNLTPQATAEAFYGRFTWRNGSAIRLTSRRTPPHPKTLEIIVASEINTGGNYSKFPFDVSYGYQAYRSII